jgi:Zn-dependent protease/CBS domain-containing protein
MAETPQDPSAETEPQPRHPWSLGVGSIAGIPIRIHFTFWLLLAWIAWLAYSSGRPVGTQVGLIAALFGCIVLHELGHALTAKLFGIRTRDITLYPIGGISRLQNMGKPLQELFISVAGPAVNVAIALALAIVLQVMGQPLTPEIVESNQLTFMQWLFVGNVCLAAFNFVPAFPMDGGRILRAALALRVGTDRATRIAATISQGLAVLMGLAGLLSSNPMLIFIALFVFLGASGEAELQRSLASTSGHTMREAMITRFETVAHADTLGSVVERLLRTNQEDFPVVHGDRLLGVLTRRELFAALAGEGKDALVSTVMNREFPRVGPDEDLAKALMILRSGSASPIFVLEEDRLVGIITLANLVEFMSVARAGAVPPPPPKVVPTDPAAGGSHPRTGVNE